MPKIIVTVLLVLGALILAQSVLGQSRVYGSQLMPPQERLQHRAKMRSLPPTERQQYRREHHAKMQKRAEERGLTLRPMGARSGPGYRRGWGYGRGFGYGPRPGFSPGWGYGHGRGYGPGWGRGPWY
jgi:hypothetical protein